MKEIIIYKGRDCWMADMPDAETFELFGTSQIPTPYTLKMAGWEVAAKLEELNPGYVVTVSAGGI